METTYYVAYSPRGRNLLVTGWGDILALLLLPGHYLLKFEDSIAFYDNCSIAKLNDIIVDGCEIRLITYQKNHQLKVFPDHIDKSDSCRVGFRMIATTAISW